MRRTSVLIPKAVSPHVLHGIYTAACVYKYRPTVYKPKEAVN